VGFYRKGKMSTDRENLKYMRGEVDRLHNNIGAMQQDYKKHGVINPKMLIFHLNDLTAIILALESNFLDERERAINRKKDS